jgi:hypothetical protein
MVDQNRGTIYGDEGNVQAYGIRNTTEGLVLVRIKHTRIVAEKDIAGWD